MIMCCRLVVGDDVGVGTGIGIGDTLPVPSLWGRARHLGRGLTPNIFSREHTMVRRGRWLARDDKAAWLAIASVAGGLALIWLVAYLVAG